MTEDPSTTGGTVAGDGTATISEASIVAAAVGDGTRTWGEVIQDGASKAWLANKIVEEEWRHPVTEMMVRTADYFDPHGRLEWSVVVCGLSCYVAPGCAWSGPEPEMDYTRMAEKFRFRCVHHAAESRRSEWATMADWAESEC